MLAIAVGLWLGASVCFALGWIFGASLARAGGWEDGYEHAREAHIDQQRLSLAATARR